MNSNFDDFSFMPIGDPYTETDLGTIGVPITLKTALKNNIPFYRLENSGVIEGNLDDLIKDIKSLDFSLVAEKTINKTFSYLFKNKSGFAEISSNGTSDNISCRLITTNELVRDEMKEIFKKFLSNGKKKGYVFALMKDGSGYLQTTRLGNAGLTLERNNYSESVIKDYDFIINDLRSSTPCGRIVLLDGVPGTGKTSLIKSIFQEVENTIFLIIPPGMVSQLIGPELLPILIRTKEKFSKNGSITLVLEDADDCLAPRQADNISSITSLLNLGDGIFGSILDVRIIATTNAKYKELDPAITRKSRLSKRINISTFSFEEANSIFHRIIGTNEKDIPKKVEEASGMKPLTGTDKFSLADIYSFARESGWVPKSTVEDKNTAENDKLSNDSINVDFFSEEDDEDYI